MISHPTGVKASYEVGFKGTVVSRIILPQTLKITQGSLQKFAEIFASQGAPVHHRCQRHNTGGKLPTVSETPAVNLPTGGAP
jgi:hypothetical protein